MKFINTYRFSPVANKLDLPRKGDLYYINPKKVPTAEKTMLEFKAKNNIVIDKQWWERMAKYCKEGIVFENAIEKGGDNFIDGVDAIWHGNDVYLPYYDYWIFDRKLHITGRHFWYLNFWMIKRVNPITKRKQLMAPKFTDLSWENYLTRYLADNVKDKDILWAKSRQRGLSEEEASEIGYDYTFMKESQTLIISGEEKYAKNTMNFVKRGLKNLSNTQFHKWTSISNTEEHISKYTGSEIYMRTANGNAQAASSLSPSRVLYEEIGIWTKGLLMETSEFIRQSQEAEGIRTSISRYTGTGGEMESGVDDMMDMFYNPDEHNLFSVPNKYSKQTEGSDRVATFLPAFKFELIDKDGNSLVKESIDKIEKDRARISSNKRYRAITQKPINVEEMFSVNNNGFFGDQIILWASQRLSYLLSHKEAIIYQRGRLEWITDLKHWRHGVKFIPDPEGDVYISEHPRTYTTLEDKKTVVKVYNGLYKAGTDSYDVDEALTSSSKGSCWIRKTFLNANDTYNKYVAYITQRPETNEGGREVFYENSAKLCVYYWAFNLIEHSKLLIFQWYQTNGLSYFLKERPKAVIARKIIDSQQSNEYGVDASFKPYFLKMLKDYYAVKSNIDQIDFPYQCEKIMKFKLLKTYNCDDTIAQALCEVQVEEDKEQLMKPKEESEEKPTRAPRYKTVNGKLQLILS